jgi:hypothetical protein
LSTIFTCPITLAIQFTALGQLVVQTLKQEFELEILKKSYLDWFIGFGALGM